MRRYKEKRGWTRWKEVALCYSVSPATPKFHAYLDTRTATYRATIIGQLKRAGTARVTCHPIIIRYRWRFVHVSTRRAFPWGSAREERGKVWKRISRGMESKRERRVVTILVVESTIPITWLRILRFAPHTVYKSMRKTPSLTSLQMRGRNIFIVLPSLKHLWIPIYLTTLFVGFCRWHAELCACEKRYEKRKVTFFNQIMLKLLILRKKNFKLGTNFYELCTKGKSWMLECFFFYIFWVLIF